MTDDLSEFEKLFEARPGQKASPQDPIEHAWDEVRSAHSAAQDLEVTLVERSPRGWRVKYGLLEGELWTEEPTEWRSGDRVRLRVLKFDMDKPELVFFSATTA